MNTQREALGTVKHTVSRTGKGLLFSVFLCGGLYLYAVNRVAVQGYAIRSVEYEADQLKQDNNRLRIQEAELKSLYRIEAAGRRLRMFEPVTVSYLEDSRSIALR